MALAWFILALAVGWVLTHPEHRFAASPEKYPGRPWLYRVLVYNLSTRELATLHRFHTYRRWAGGVWVRVDGQWAPGNGYARATYQPRGGAGAVEAYHD